MTEKQRQVLIEVDNRIPDMQAIKGCLKKIKGNKMMFNGTFEPKKKLIKQ